MSKFLTSLNTAQKVKKFKDLTSVKEFLRSLTEFFGKIEQKFPSSKKKSFSSKEKIPTSKEKNPMFEEVFRRKDTKKGGQHDPPFLCAKILQKIAISKSAFRTVFTNINNFTLYFAI